MALSLFFKYSCYHIIYYRGLFVTKKPQVELSLPVAYDELLEPVAFPYFLILSTGMMLFNFCGRETTRASFVRVNFTFP